MVVVKGCVQNSTGIDEAPKPKPDLTKESFSKDDLKEIKKDLQ